MVSEVHIGAALRSGPYAVVAVVRGPEPIASGPILVWADAGPYTSWVVPSAETEASDSASPQLGDIAPTEFALDPVFPNPSAGAARLRYALPDAATVRLSIYDALGREVAVFAGGDRMAGIHDVGIDVRRLAPGGYHARRRAGSFSATVPFVVAR